MPCMKSCCILCRRVSCAIIKQKFLLILPRSSHLVPLLHQGKNNWKGMDPQVLMLKEEQDISWNLITIFVLSPHLCTRSATRPQAQGLPFSWYSSKCNVAHLNLGCVFGIMGMLDAQLTTFASHGASYWVLLCLHRQRVLFSLVLHLPASTSAMDVLESISPLFHPCVPVSFSPSKLSQRSCCCLLGASNPPPSGWVQGPDFHLNKSLLAFCWGFPTAPAREQGAHCSQTGCSASPDVPAVLNAAFQPLHWSPGRWAGGEQAPGPGQHATHFKHSQPVPTAVFMVE